MKSFLAWIQGLQINFPSESPAPCGLSEPAGSVVLGSEVCLDFFSIKKQSFPPLITLWLNADLGLPQGYGSHWDRTAGHLPREGETRLQLEGGEMEAESRY